MHPLCRFHQWVLGLWQNALFLGARGRAVAPKPAIKLRSLWWCDGAYHDYLKANFWVALKPFDLQHFAKGLHGHGGWYADWPFPVAGGGVCGLMCWPKKWFSQHMRQPPPGGCLTGLLA